MVTRIVSVLLIGLGLQAAANQSAYENAVNEFRATREAKLKADYGWLTVVGLHWLKPGENIIGSATNSDVVLPASTPARVGVLILKDGKVRFRPNPSANAMIAGKAASEMELVSDLTPQYTRVQLGRVQFLIVDREGKVGVRVRDNDSAARKAFTTLKWYPVDPNWKVQAKFIPSPHTLTFDTMIGVKERDKSPGYVSFHREGKEYKLEAALDGDELWFVIRDQTSGKATYAASRFLYTPLPSNGLDKPGTVELDFNRAENPPCVFTDFATCPLPPPQNRLTLAVTAGEMMYGKQH